MKEYSDSDSYDDNIVTIELTKKIKELQKKLKAESSVSYIEEQYLKYRQKKFQETIVSYAITQKRFYTSVFLLFQLMRNKDQNNIEDLLISFINSTNKKISPKNNATEHPFDYSNILNNGNDVEKDILTFSTIPSECEFFLTEKGVDKYFKILEPYKTEDAKFKILTRSLFFSPLFLNFISSVFYTTVTGMSPPNDDNMSLEEIKKSIKDKWSSNRGHIPSYIIRLLKMKDASLSPEEMLSGFFELVFEKPNTNQIQNMSYLHISLMLDYLHLRTNGVCEKLSKILAVKNENSILKDLVNISINQSINELKFQTVKPKNFNFEFKILSSIDLSIIGGIMQFTLRMDYVNEYIYIKMDPIQIDQSNKNNEKIKFEESKKEYLNALRSLLKNADIIPCFNSIDNNDMKVFIKEYLVERGPAKSYVERLHCFNVIETNDFEDISSNLDLINLFYNKITPSLSALDNAFSTFKNSIDSLENPIFQEMNNLLLFNYIKRYLGLDFGQDNFSNLLSKFKTKLSENGILNQENEFIKVMLTLYVSKFNYKEYRDNRDNQQYLQQDNQIYDFIKQNKQGIIKGRLRYDKTTNPGEFNKKKYIKQKVESIVCNDLKELISLALSEDNPYTKFKFFASFINKCDKFLIKGAPKSAEFGGDEVAPFHDGVIVMFNIKGFASNYSFLEEAFNEVQQDRTIQNYHIMDFATVPVFLNQARYLPREQ